MPGAPVAELALAELAVPLGVLLLAKGRARLNIGVAREVEGRDACVLRRRWRRWDDAGRATRGGARGRLFADRRRATGRTRHGLDRKAAAHRLFVDTAAAVALAARAPINRIQVAVAACGRLHGRSRLLFNMLLFVGRLLLWLASLFLLVFVLALLLFCYRTWPIL
eukprot:6210817-Pleurochrysis_carterae.AAC.2